MGDTPDASCPCGATQRGSSFKDAAALGLGSGVSSLVLLNNY